MKVVITQNNPIGKVNFSKVAKSITALGDLIDVNTSGQQDGYILSYQANTNSYVFIQNQATPVSVDGGFY